MKLSISDAMRLIIYFDEQIEEARTIPNEEVYQATIKSLTKIRDSYLHYIEDSFPEYNEEKIA